MVSTQVFHTKWCCTVDCFFQEIDNLGVNQQHQTWLFRGQNRDWPLRPPSMRYPFLRRYVVPAYRYLRQVIESKSAEQLSADAKLNLKLYVQRRVEDLTVRRFAEVADRSHLHVPTDSRFELGGEFFKINADELEHAVLGTLEPLRPPTSVVDALAQHHRVPTRLIDWTYSPYVAAYFATCIDLKDEAKRHQHKHDPMVVWAVNYTSLELQNSDLSLVVQPRSQVGYLKAQDGAFLFDKKADRDYRERKRWVCFEEKLSKSEFANTYVKYEIPFGQHSTLRRRLMQFGMSEPNLMPSFDVVRKWTLDYYAKHPESLFWLPQ